MRIGCLQFAPQVGDVNNNLNRADAVLSKANPDELDLLVLPELAFSGYNFKSLQEISPFLEYSGSGITSLWARTIALKYNCIVTVGYPEKVDLATKWPTNPEYYNSAIVVNADGETIANYRKSFLYYTDESWALEGNGGFFDGCIPGLGNTSIGICMDLNPYKFEAPWDAFEFAVHVLEVDSNVVILSMAWMTREEPRKFTRMPNEPDMETLTYWVTRLEPLIRADKKDEIIVIFCNRCGNEDEVLYAGTSAVIGIQDGEVRVYGLLGRGEKELLVVDTNSTPYARLVYRPESGQTGVMEANEKPQEPDQSERANKRPSQHSDNSPTETGYGSHHSQPGSDGTNRQSANSTPKPDCRVPNQQLPLRSTIYKGPVSQSPRRRQTPTISVPQTSDMVNLGSVRSPGTSGLNVPTPSAPSPTPMALRPRLVIPQSPSAITTQYPQDMPLTASSMKSDRSVQSIDSNTSVASTSTVRSNHRPPEDSTPYPDSAIPTAHPSGFFKSKRRLFGDDLDSAIDHNALDRDLAFDHVSATTSRWLWDSTDTAVPTPASSRWAAGTPVGRKPEPFPWPAIKADARPQSTDTVKSGTRLAALQGSRAFDSQTPLSNASSNRTTGTVISDSSVISQGAATSLYKREPSPQKTSPQKSERSSRSRTYRQPPLIDEDPSDTYNDASQQLAAIFRQADSRNGTSDQHSRRSTTATPFRDRPPSTKVRNSSRNHRKASQDFVMQDDHMFPITIIASPSILPSDGHKRHRSVSKSKSGHHHRSNSIAGASNDPRRADAHRSGTSATHGDSSRTASRAASRGRTPGPRGFPTNGQLDQSIRPSERSSSIDSTRNELLHSRIEHPRSQSKQHRSRRPSTGRHSRQPSRDHHQPADFERFEAVVCPTCPLHGRSSSTHGAQSVPIALSVDHLPQRGRSVGDVALPHSAQLEHDILQPIQGLGELETLNRRRDDQTYRQLRHVSSSSDVVDSSERSSSVATLETISSGRSPTTPPYFNPAQTPRAMVFTTDDSDIEVFPTGDLNGRPASSKSLTAPDELPLAEPTATLVA
ncbi:hypothetical protein FDECE_17187 [Fusarium decemcellulare]|nr:hypothetical protein FDECE_17187 [Fusarium decemcellulare]